MCLRLSLFGSARGFTVAFSGLKNNPRTWGTGGLGKNPKRATNRSIKRLRGKVQGVRGIAVIDKSLFRKVEYELYNYQAHVKELNELQAEILHAGPDKAELPYLKSNIASDTTGKKGAKLAEVMESEQAKWVKVIHDTLRILPRELKMLVKCKYFDGMKNEAVAMRLHISRSLFYEWREDVIIQIVLLATQRGLIKPIREKTSKNGAA